MADFNKILARAEERKGGPAGLALWLPKAPKTAAQLARIPDDRALAEMARCVFKAGFVWRVIDQKWPEFEEVFFGFAPEKLVMMSPERWEALGHDTRIVRSMQKIMSVAHNARFVLDVAQEYGSFGKMIAKWPADDQIGLLDTLKKRGSRLGGATGMRVLRNLGMDIFILSEDVLVCLKAAGLDLDEGNTKRERKLIQQTFSQWQRSTGRSYSELSRICSCSTGKNNVL